MSIIEQLQRLEKQTPSEFAALEAIHQALKPLDPDARSRVLGSVCALLVVDAREVEAGMKRAGVE
jgi:hypothetical protein